MLSLIVLSSQPTSLSKASLDSIHASCLAILVAEIHSIADPYQPLAGCFSRWEGHCCAPALCVSSSTAARLAGSLLS